MTHRGVSHGGGDGGGGGGGRLIVAAVADRTAAAASDDAKIAASTSDHISFAWVTESTTVTHFGLADDQR